LRFCTDLTYPRPHQTDDLAGNDWAAPGDLLVLGGRSDTSVQTETTGSERPPDLHDPCSRARDREPLQVPGPQLYRIESAGCNRNQEREAWNAHETGPAPAPAIAYNVEEASACRARAFARSAGMASAATGVTVACSPATPFDIRDSTFAIRYGLHRPQGSVQNPSMQ